MYPEDCIQVLIEPSKWWIEDGNKDFRRGRLVWAFVLISEQTPLKLTPIGRDIPTEHNSATVKIEPLRVNDNHRKTQLPVAALPQFSGEERGVYRVKRRPAIIVADGCEDVPEKLTRGTPNRSTARSVLVAPYYGCDKGQGRAGYNQAFVDQVRHCTFPQFLWDVLPLKGVKESLLRLDQTQPLGRHHNAVEATEYCLSPEALEVFDDYLQWYIFEVIPPDGFLVDIKEGLSLFRQLR